MPKIVPYSLTFRSGLHIGTRGVNLEETGLSVPADTFFAALLDVWGRQAEDIEAFIAPFRSKPPAPPFLLTSLFPRAGRVRFYPMPLDLERIFSESTLKNRGKGIRRIRFISEGLLLKALSGQRLDADLFPENAQDEPTHGIGLQQDTMWLSLLEMQALPASFQRAPGKWHAISGLSVYHIGEVPRVTISRIASTATIFQAGRVVFAQDCGLWFGVNWITPAACVPGTALDYRQAFHQSLALLQDDGLGGERTTGYGAFKYQEETALSLGADPHPGGLTLLLSRYHPQPGELPGTLEPEKSVSYHLVGISGWLRSPEGAAQRRKKLYMVGEGSLVALPGLPAGDITDVCPDYPNPAGRLSHKVYRYGLAFGPAWSDSER